jgi:hypothetical protein
MKMYPPYPHMALNSHNVPPPDYKMFNSWKVKASDTPAFMISQIVAIAGGLPGKKWETVIFNSHGGPGRILIGTGITMTDIPLFAQLKGKATQIWIVACQVAGGAPGSGGTPGSIVGVQFCQAMADQSEAVVYASEKNQSVEEPSLGVGEIDFYEGKTYMFRKGFPPFVEQP